MPIPISSLLPPASTIACMPEPLASTVRPPSRAVSSDVEQLLLGRRLDVGDRVHVVGPGDRADPAVLARAAAAPSRRPRRRRSACPPSGRPPSPAAYCASAACTGLASCTFGICGRVCEVGDERVDLVGVRRLAEGVALRGGHDDRHARLVLGVRRCRRRAPSGGPAPSGRGCRGSRRCRPSAWRPCRRGRRRRSGRRARPRRRRASGGRRSCRGGRAGWPWFLLEEGVGYQRHAGLARRSVGCGVRSGVLGRFRATR